MNHAHTWICADCGVRRYRTVRRTDTDERRLTAYARGDGVSAIARAEGVTRQAIYATLRKHGIIPRH